MKGVIPESIITGQRRRVDARSWDAALDLVQQSILGMAVANDMNDDQDRVLTAVVRECVELRSKKYLEIVATNRELAKKYAISPRTVTNWRKKAARSTRGNGKCSIECSSGPTCRAERKKSSLASSSADFVARAVMCATSSFC